MEVIRENKNVFGDGIASIEEYDPSLSNRTHEDRLFTVTSVASVCYNSPGVIGKQSLYDRLSVEGAGIPSSSFSFIPVLLTEAQVDYVARLCGARGTSDIPDIVTFGELVQSTINGIVYIRLLTNLRALLQDLGWQEDGAKAQTLSEEFFNTSEIDIMMIKEHYRVYKIKIDIATSKQWNRHNYHLQELSRRYVSAKKLGFEFYISEDMKSVESSLMYKDDNDNYINVDTEEVIAICMNHYNTAVEKGVAPQSARRIIPQCAYTTIWTGITPRVFKNMLALRTKPSTQWEFRQLALQISEWEASNEADKETPKEAI